jgi:hypothetical protein
MATRGGSNGVITGQLDGSDTQQMTSTTSDLHEQSRLAQRLLASLRQTPLEGPHQEARRSALLLAHLEAAGLTIEELKSLAATAQLYVQHVEGARTPATAQLAIASRRVARDPLSARQ